MKYYFALILFFISSTFIAQTLEEQKMFLNTISNHNENGIIPYVTKRYDYDLAINLKHSSLRLSRKNIREIIKKNKKMSFNFIYFSQIDSLTFIELKQDSVFNYLQEIRIKDSKARHYLQEQNDLTTLRKLDKKLFHYVYSFGAPIYYNSNQSCLIQSAEYCGDCGITKISIFNKINNRWELIKFEITGEF